MDNERKKRVAKWILQHTRGQAEARATKSSEIYSKLLCRIAAADGVLAPSEREWIIGHRAALGKIIYDLSQFYSFDSLCIWE